MIFYRSSLGLLAVMIAALAVIAVGRPPSTVTKVASASVLLPPRAVPVPRVVVAGQLGLIKPVSTKGLEALAGAMSRTTAAKLNSAFTNIGYDLDAIRTGDGEVPRLFLARLPKDLNSVRETQRRKALFFRAILPLVLQANEEIENDRRRLWRLRSQQRMGQHLSALDRLWLIVVAERYKVKPDSVDALFTRMDIVPPSLALAQAAEESGWGSSRFAHEGNAIFGQWTYSKKSSLTPKDRKAGATHNVRAFETLLDSVRAYMRNLNTHRAYRELRQARSDMRATGEALNGRSLATQLTRYSERGQEYVSALHSIMNANNLGRLDKARFREGPTLESPLTMRESDTSAFAG